MLVLFDIDATLLMTYGAGVRAMEAAGREMYGPSFALDDIGFAGGLDPLIWNDLAVANHVADPQGDLPRFIEVYHAKLVAGLDEDEVSTLLPGALDLVEALAAEPDVTLGLLTGNFEITGRLKVARTGMSLSHFQVFAWGTDGTDRSDLPPVAMARYQKLHGRPIDPSLVTIIGDTPHDVRCALENGCRVLAVATGYFSADELRAAGAHHVVEDLSDTQAIVRWLLKPQADRPAR
ncbi:MAG: haloacid dehalogenase-like hydrolase [Phycisphaerales bacterium]|nr:haloacid dehalogenase-like hydrolase [Phycisphaerales bacterium]